MKESIISPVSSDNRIQSLDLLRGFAILGILIMNIQSFSMPGAAYMNPSSYGDFSGLNRWVWIVGHVLADQKFMTIFSILFGAGIVLVTQNAESKYGKSAGLHYKRNFWLLLIGLIHGHLIWYGDILVAYALCGFLVYLFRKKSPASLIIIGLILFSIHSLIYWFFGTSIPNWPAESVIEAKASWIPSQAEIIQEIQTVTGPVSQQLSHNSESALFLETMVFFSLMLWRAGGLMLIGMGLYKMGVLSAQKSTKFYQRGMLLGWFIGFPIVIYGMMKNFEAGWSFEYSMFLGSQWNYWGSLFVSLGYICLVMLIAKSDQYHKLKNRIAAIGQMALTNYISQSVICIFIFHGIGLSLFGQIERSGQVLVVLFVWTIQILWSRPWLTRYRFGPLEWLWRSLTYGKSQPMK